MNTFNAPFKKLNELIKPPNRSRLRLTYDDPFDMPERIFEKFLEIMKKDPSKRIHQEVILIMHYLNSTELMQKLKSESEFSTQTSFEHLMFMSAANLNFREVKKDEIIFDINDDGDYFYILFLGKLAVMKPKELPKEKLSQSEYFEYLNNLIQKKEIFLLNKTLIANYESFPIKNLEQLELFQKYLLKLKILSLARSKSYEEFMNLIYEKTDSAKGSNYENDMFNYLNECGVDFDYLKKLGQNETNAKKEKDSSSSTKYFENQSENQKVNQKDLNSPQNSEIKNEINLFSSNKNINSSIFTWASYLQHKIEISLEEMINFEKIEEGMKYKKQKRDFIIFDYEVSIFINEGQYFGDYALDNRDQKRTARIQATENSFIGFISHDIYNQYIKNEKAKIRVKEFSFINEFFFFNKLNLKKNFMSEFYLLNVEKGRNLFERGKKFENMYLIKEGEVVITFSGSIIDLFEMIEKILKNFEIIINQKLNANLQLNKYVNVNNFIKYLSEDQKNFRKLKNKSVEYIKYINKKRNCNICIMSSKEICGMEEFFLGAENYFNTATVISKNAKVYKLRAEKVKSLLEEENHGIYSILKNSVGKVVTLIKRIDNIKSTWMEKFEENNGSDLLRNRNHSQEPDFNFSENKRNSLENYSKHFNSNIEANEKESLLPDEKHNNQNTNKDKIYNMSFHHNHAIFISSSNNNKNWTHSDLEQFKHKKTQSENIQNFITSRYSQKIAGDNSNYNGFNLTNKFNGGKKKFNDEKSEKKEKPNKRKTLENRIVPDNQEKYKFTDETKFFDSPLNLKSYFGKIPNHLKNDHTMKDVAIQTNSFSNLKSFFLSPNISKQNLSSVIVSSHNSHNNLPQIPNLQLNYKMPSSDMNPKLQISLINFQDIKKSNLSPMMITKNSEKNDKISFLNTVNIPNFSNNTSNKNKSKVEEIKNMKKTFQIPFVKRMKKIKLAKLKKENKNSYIVNRHPENDVVELEKKFNNPSSNIQEKIVDLFLDDDHHNNSKELKMRHTIRTVKEFFKIKKNNYEY